MIPDIVFLFVATSMDHSPGSQTAFTLSGMDSTESTVSARGGGVCILSLRYYSNVTGTRFIGFWMSWSIQLHYISHITLLYNQSSIAQLQENIACNAVGEQQGSVRAESVATHRTSSSAKRGGHANPQAYRVHIMYILNVMIHHDYPKAGGPHAHGPPLGCLLGRPFQSCRL